MRNIFPLVITLAVCLCSASVANAGFRGNWSFDPNVDGREVLALGDERDGTMLLLRGTVIFCGVKGDSYAQIRGVLVGNGINGQKIDWWVSHVCPDGYVRICVRNRFNETGCSTYMNFGWSK